MIELDPVPTDVMKLFMLLSAFSKCVPPDPRVVFTPVSNRLASCGAKLVIVARSGWWSANGAGIAAASSGVQRFWMNGIESDLELIGDHVVGLCVGCGCQQLGHRVADGIGAQLNQEVVPAVAQVDTGVFLQFTELPLVVLVVPLEKDVGVVPKREMIKPWQYPPGLGFGT